MKSEVQALTLDELIIKLTDIKNSAKVMGYTGEIYPTISLCDDIAFKVAGEDIKKTFLFKAPKVCEINSNFNNDKLEVNIHGF